VPDIRDVAREERPRLTPIGAIIVLNLAECSAADLSGSAVGPSAIDRCAVTPPRIVFDAIGRVGDHQVRLDAAEHALDVRRDRAVAAEEAMPPEDPQIARHRG
jgi:hypothetical protein